MITEHTRFAAVSPAWYLSFFAIGYLLGAFFVILAFASLMIRSSEEARKLELPRIPVAARVQFILWTPAVVLLIVGYYVLRYFSPEAIHELAILLFALPFLAVVGQELGTLYFSKDRLREFREMHDSHDYSYQLGDRGRRAAQHLHILAPASPKAIQDAMRRKFAVGETADPLRFRVEQKEEIQISIYAKDGHPNNKSPKNRGIRIQKQQGKPDLLRVLIIPENSHWTSREMEIPIALVKAYAEEYLSTESRDIEKDYGAMLSYAINQTAIKTMVGEFGPSLHRAVESGQEKWVKKLLEQDIDVNERAEAGWTALLYASAQGYPLIAKLLLEAGANPDIGNVRNITPLMYSARYGNEEICKLLINYGANLNLQDANGETALMVAARTGQPKIAKLLITAGAETQIRNGEAKSALDLAHLHKQGAIAKLLRVSANKPR